MPLNHLSLPQTQVKHYAAHCYDYFCELRNWSLSQDRKKTLTACCRDECVVCVLRCADAVLPAGSCEADSGKPQGVPAVVELIPSSQGSPVINPSALMLHLTQTDEPNQFDEPDDACASATTTPASSMVTKAS